MKIRRGAGAHEAGPKQGCAEDPSGEEEREEGEQDPVGGRGGGGPGVLEGEERAERGRQMVDAFVVVVLVREERGRAVGVLAVVVAFAAAAAAAGGWGGEERGRRGGGVGVALGGRVGRARRRRVPQLRHGRRRRPRRAGVGVRTCFPVP